MTETPKRIVPRQVPPDDDIYTGPVPQARQVPRSNLTPPYLEKGLVTEKLGQGADGEGGFRLNAGKNRIELLPEIWIWALADVMTKGSMKYPERNWEKGMDWSSMIGCMHRHIAKFQSGQRYDGPRFDQELGTTGCHELAMVAWNALALMYYDLKGIGNNDIPSQQLDLFIRVNAETSDLAERTNEV